MLAYGTVPRLKCGVACPFSPATTSTFVIHNVRFTPTSAGRYLRIVLKNPLIDKSG
jgi:hypothetical protein